MNHHVRATAVAAIAALAAACGEPSTAPVHAGADVYATSVKFWEAGASVTWNQTARNLLVARAVGAPHVQSRILTYLSLAQYNALVTAEDTKTGGTHASPSAAVAGASVVFPLDGALIDAQLAQQLAATPWPGEQRTDAASVYAVGRTVGADVLAYAATDNFNVLIPPPAPGGLAEGYWVSATPSVRGAYGSRPFFLLSGDQFRPAPPPAFNSPAFLADLAEIRALSDGRTAAQIAEAQYWAARGPMFMNEVAAKLIVAHKQTERDAAHILALANMVMFDAGIGCFDAKFAYWYIRPTMADPAITLAIPLPNHPSYISGHSCNTASGAAILAHAFPTETARLDDYMIRAGLSRMYGGLHYRFDITAGQQLGRDVAEWALAHDVAGHEPFPLD